MPDQIIDGTGKGYRAKVNSAGQIEARSQSESLQHSQSSLNQQAYQVKSTVNLAAGTLSTIHIKNVSKTKNMVVTYIRHQPVAATGGTPLPNVSNYMTPSFGRTRSSGGAELTPINMFNGSGNTAEVQAYSEATLTGTARDFDDWYTKADADMNTWNKEGSLIVGPNNTFELKYTTDHTSGIIFTRVSFIMKNINGGN